MKKSILLLAVAACAASRIGLEPARYIEVVKYLSSPELKGRGNGTPELDKAARYLADQYKAIGLEPAFAAKFLQPFTLTTNAKLGSKNKFSESISKKKFEVERDFVPFNFSSSGKVSGPVVFAGYGITAKEYGYDDYGSIDVAGKIVLVLRYEPQEFDEKSVFAGRTQTRHAQFDSKAINAKMHGAKGVILINNPVTHPNDIDRLEKFGRTAGPSEAGIPFVQVKPAAVEKWFDESGKSLKDIVEGIDRDLKPRSFEFAKSVRADLELDLVREAKTVYNVGAYLKGETDEYLIVGAHYDHLGLGEQFSLAPSQTGTPHVGADDNASGSAGVVELARYFASLPKQKRGFLFVNFAGEELGLLGSAYLTEHSPLPIDKAVAMLNMDMIGRMREDSAIVGGVGTGSSFKALLDRLSAKHAPLKLEYAAEQSGIGSSDHTSFTAKGIPVLFFFTGLHMDYHRPTDTWDKINAEGAIALLEVVAGAAGEIAGAPERPVFQKIAEPAPHSGTAPSGGGYGPSFGSVPDMAFQGKGVKFSDVRPGSPAEKAGLRAGDIMTEFDGKKIDNLYDFTYALRGKQPGDEVEVKFVRSGQPSAVRVKLEARR
ncbi:MAG: M28 family peptidase [Bryobacteraceae bacterium]|nr:M28 family peptidase [Bryobacteraceae bacterium]